jgi:hypothetical protein
MKLHKLPLAGAGFHPEQIFTGRGRREVAPFDSDNSPSRDRDFEIVSPAVSARNVPENRGGLPRVVDCRREIRPERFSAARSSEMIVDFKQALVKRGHLSPLMPVQPKDDDGTATG